MLVMLTIAAYATSFLRERYLLQEALGTIALDSAAVAYGLAAMVGNLWAVALSLIWIDGQRSIYRGFRQFAVVGVVGAVLLPFSGWLSGAIMLGSAVAAFEFHRQRAAFAGKQTLAIAAAVVSPVGTVVFWELIGVGSLTKIVLGYAVGFGCQALAATAAGRGAEPAVRDQSRVKVSLAWPIAFALVTQANGILDRLLLVVLDTGWSAANAFGINLATAMMLVVVGPLSSEAVAGRLRVRPLRGFVAITVCVALVAALLLPIVLPVIIGGQMVGGTSLEKVRDQSILYMLSIPGAGYWLYRARALQTGADMWRQVTISGVAVLSVHAIVAVPSVAAGKPLGPAVGWLISSYVGAAMLAKATLGDGSAGLGTPGDGRPAQR